MIAALRDDIEVRPGTWLCLLAALVTSFGLLAV